MYYSSGKYEAFARPEKPEGIERKSAYIVGTGLAALSAACYLVRDAQMPGENIHIYEKDDVPGGACDGRDIPGIGYVMRGGREMDNHFEVMWDLFRSIPSIENADMTVLDEYYRLNKIPGIGYVMRGGREMDNHFEVMWDLFRSIPSIENADMTVLDEYYRLNKRDPNYSLCRVTCKRGLDAGTGGRFGLSDKAAVELLDLFLTPDEDLYGRQLLALPCDVQARPRCGDRRQVRPFGQGRRGAPGPLPHAR